jgi:hypothetical protein
MASLSNKIREYAKANGINEVDFLNDVMLQDDSNGKGAYIKKWNLDIAQPTQAQLDALDAQADFNIVIKNLRAKRNKLLADTDYQYYKIAHLQMHKLLKKLFIDKH